MLWLKLLFRSMFLIQIWWVGVTLLAFLLCLVEWVAAPSLLALHSSSSAWPNASRAMRSGQMTKAAVGLDTRARFGSWHWRAACGMECSAFAGAAGRGPHTADLGWDALLAQGRLGISGCQAGGARLLCTVRASSYPPLERRCRTNLSLRLPLGWHLLCHGLGTLMCTVFNQRRCR